VQNEDDAMLCGHLLQGGRGETPPASHSAKNFCRSAASAQSSSLWDASYFLRLASRLCQTCSSVLCRILSILGVRLSPTRYLLVYIF
jgi:hypothetical protein